jgi:hypothetical protein
MPFNLASSGGAAATAFFPVGLLLLFIQLQNIRKLGELINQESDDHQ